MRIFFLLGATLALSFGAQPDTLDRLYGKIVSFERQGITLEEMRRAPDPFAYRFSQEVMEEGERVETPKVAAIFGGRAKIGERWLRQGESYGGWKVLLIERDRVRLESPLGERRYYPLYESKDLKVEKR